MKRLVVVLLCAWVLWEGVISQQGQREWNWLPSQAVEAAKECDALLRAEMADRETKLTSRTIIGGVAIDRLSGTETIMMRTFRCLPDTIDPRGPKR